MAQHWLVGSCTKCDQPVGKSSTGVLYHILGGTCDASPIETYTVKDAS